MAANCDSLLVQTPQSRDRFSAMKDAPDNGTDVEKAGMLGDDSVATRCAACATLGGVSS